MSRAVVVLACVALVAAAGIAGVAQPTPQPSATTGENETAPSAYPPGASADGIENASRLLDAHRAVLGNVSYRERSEWDHLMTVSRNGTPSEPEVRRYTITAENGTNGTAVEIAGGNESNGYWFTDEATMTKVTHEQYGPEALYTYVRGYDQYFERLRYIAEVGSDGVGPYLRDLDYEFVGTESVANRTRYVYSSTGIDETVQPNRGDTPLGSTTDSINATVVIDERGVIESFSARELHTVRNETVTLNHTFRVTGVGETVTTPPEWVTEEIARVDASITGNGSVLEVTHLGGPSMSEPGLFLTTPTEYGVVGWNGTIEPGETIYLSLTVKAGSNETRLQSAREPPSVNSSYLSLGPGNVSVLTSRYLFLDDDPAESIESIEVTVERPTGNESGTAERS